MRTAHCRDISATQKNANQIYVQQSTGKSLYLHTDLTVTDFCLTKLHLAVTNERQIAVYKVVDNSQLLDDTKSFAITPMNTFTGESVQLFVYEENILALGHADVKIFSLGGVMLRQLHFNDTEGEQTLSKRYFICVWASRR